MLQSSCDLVVEFPAGCSKPGPAWCRSMHGEWDHMIQRGGISSPASCCVGQRQQFAQTCLVHRPMLGHHTIGIHQS